MLKRILGLSALLVLASVSALAQASAQAPKPPQAPKTHLKVGDAAPDFTLPGTDGKTYKLSDFKGRKTVVLAFYALAFTGGWTKEMKAYQADIAKFEENDTQIFGLSMDAVPSNKEFAKQLGVAFPLLSDWDRTVVKDYGIYTPGKDKFLTRATFVVDKEGIIRHIEEGGTAIDPTAAFQACTMLKKK